MNNDHNPLRAGLRLDRVPGPCGVIIFGASGDLTKRKLVPALYSLLRQNLLPASFYIVGSGRTTMTSEVFRDGMRTAMKNLPMKASAMKRSGKILLRVCTTV